MATVHQWGKSLELPVVDALTGEQSQVWVPWARAYVPLIRNIWNSPYQWMFPDGVADVIVIDWRPLHDAMAKELKLEFAKAKAKGQRMKGYDALLKQRVLAKVEAGVVFNGQTYYAFGWGSGAKDFQTLGFTSDVCKKLGLVQVVEDYVRVARAMFPNGMYGGGVVRARIKFVADNTTVGDYVVADGTSLTFDDVIDPLLDPERSPIELSDGNQNFQIWQRFAWTPAYAQEFKGQAVKLVKQIRRMPAAYVTKFAEIGEYKRRLLDADPFMVHHPMFSAPVIRKAAEVLFNIGTTMNVDGVIRVMAPSRSAHFVVDQDGTNFLVVRWPVDAASNIQAVKVGKGHLYNEEVQRLRNMRIIQDSMTSKGTLGPVFTSKGTKQVVARFTNDFDICMCVEDIKVVAGVSNIDDWRKSMVGKTVEWEFFLSITQLFGPESICLAPYETWKRMGGDYDGDMGFIMCVDHLPEVFRQAWAWRKESNSYKVKKSRTYDFTKTWDFLYMSWGNGVGFAVNVAAGTYAEQDRSDLLRTLAGEYPSMFAFLKGEKPTVKHLDYVLNRLIKVYTDIFKTMSVKDKEEHEMLCAIQSVYTARYGGTPAWIIWRRSPVAFRSEVPGLRSNLPEDVLKAAQKPHSEVRRSEEYRIHLADEVLDATVARMYMYMRKWIYRQWMHLKDYGTYALAESLKTAPLGDFVNWAPSVGDVDLLEARYFVETYATLQQSTDFTSAESIEHLRENSVSLLDKLIQEKFGGSRKLASYALWRASHYSRSSIAGAGAVFTSMPEEALDIVRNKPGQYEGTSVRVREGETLLEVAMRMGIGEEELRAANMGVATVREGDYVVLPKTGYQCPVVGSDHNFSRLEDTIGPFKGKVLQTIFEGKTRLLVVTDEVLPFHTGSELNPDAVALVPRMDISNEVEGMSSPLPGDYVIVMNRLKGKSRYMARFSPI